MNDNNGYYPQFRDESQIPLFNHGIFDNWHAYSDLKSLAQYRAKEIPVNSKTKVNLNKGELFTSRKKLAERWSWEPSKVKRFLYQLEDLGLIELQSGRKGTKIKIIRLANFQSSDQLNDQVSDQQNDQQKLSKIKGLQGTSDQQNDQLVTNKVTNRMTNKNSVITRDCNESVTNKVTNNVTNNTEKSNIKNSVCVYRATQESKLLFSDQEYNRLCDEYTQEETDGRIHEMLEWATDHHTTIENPGKMIKTWKRKYKNPGKQRANQGNHTKTPNQRKPVQNTFNNFSQRNYDMDELEKKLMGF